MTDKTSVFALYDRAYRLLDRVTPRRYNCGRLCGAVCCRNLAETTDHNTPPTGMLLLPFEKEYLQRSGAEGFLYVCDSTHKDADMLLCGGVCRRCDRPIACRLFPYYADIKTDRNGLTQIRVRPDPRAVRICPLITHRSLKRCAPRFIRNVKRAVRVLSHDPEIWEDLKKTSDFLQSLYDFYEKIAQ